jgi:hypothetical protein
MHQLTITSPEGVGRNATVLIDGEPAKGLTGITLTLEADSVNLAELRLFAPQITFDGQAAITIPDELAGTLIALGWTPPEDDDEDELPCLNCEDSCCDDDEPDSGPYGIIASFENGTESRAATGAEAMAWADDVVANGTLPEDHPSVVHVRATYAREQAGTE